jgi:hypothetical protein
VAATATERQGLARTGSLAAVCSVVQTTGNVPLVVAGSVVSLIEHLLDVRTMPLFESTRTSLPAPPLFPPPLQLSMWATGANSCPRVPACRYEGLPSPRGALAVAGRGEGASEKHGQGQDANGVGARSPVPL